MRAKIVDTLAPDHPKSPAAATPRRDEKPVAGQAGAGKTQGQVKPITVRIFQIPDQLQERTRAERNVGRNAHGRLGPKSKGTRPPEGGHTGSIFQSGSSAYTTLEGSKHLGGHDASISPN